MNLLKDDKIIFYNQQILKLLLQTQQTKFFFLRKMNHLPHVIPWLSKSISGSRLQ